MMAKSKKVNKNNQIVICWDPRRTAVNIILLHGMQEVSGSIPLGSTIIFNDLHDFQGGSLTSPNAVATTG
jgi:hypothetical protein